MASTIQEIKLGWDSDLLEGDLLYEGGGDLVSSSGVISAILISLFTDRRAVEDDILPDYNSTDRRGWWGDLASPGFQGDQIGSRLWLLERSKTTQKNIEAYKTYAEEALQWFVDDNVASDVIVEVERYGIIGNDRLAMRVSIVLIDGTTIAVSIEEDSAAAAISVTATIEESGVFVDEGGAAFVDEGGAAFE